VSGNVRRANCSWCGVEIYKRKICADCENQVGRVSPDEFDRLPYGAIKLNEDGIIVRINRAEEALSGLKGKGFIGKDWFDIAPCTNVRAFKGRYTSFLRSGRRSHEFNFIYKIKGRNIMVRLTLVRIPDGTLILASQK
jgi:photoactive yellow protein